MQPSARILIVVFLVTGFSGSIRSEDSASASRAANSARSTSLSFEQVAVKLDDFVESYWIAKHVPPAKLTDDATFLRRITLDLAGRIPTTRELDQFRDDESDDKRSKVIQRLIGGPEFPLHFGSVLDEMIQGRHAGNSDFVDYMRRNIRDNRSWDLVFRELMLGPWDTAERKPANRFLDKRAKTLDVLAVDATRVFFGVDISCAKCHDHPLVADWSQDHFYGMASFFNRTTGGNGKIGEKTEGDVKFLGSDGKEKTAQVMFLTGRVVGERPVGGSTADDKPPASKPPASKPVSRREQLVEIALDERKFFSRSIVNRLWRYFFGRGLVHPVDQMHSANESAIPGLLEWLAEDFAAGGYDLRRLVTAMVSSRGYQLSSEWPHDSDVPQASLFAVAGLRPLSRRQLSFSMLMATGNAELTEPDEIESRIEQYVSVPGVQRIRQYLTIEKTAAGLAPSIDERTDDFHSSSVEALFMSNNPATQTLITADDGNASSLVTRLARLDETRMLVKEAVRTVLSREPRDDELSQLTDWFERQSSPRASTTGQLLWVLMTSAEFRFNH